MASKLATLKTMTAAANARLAPQTVPTTTTANDVVLTDGATVANIQNDSAPTVKANKSAAPAVKPADPTPAPSTSLAAYVIDGFSWTFNAGDLSDDLVKATVTRDTTNPWYVVVCAMAKQRAGYLTITRDETSKAKAPTSHLWSAILRAQKLDVKGSRKLTVKSGKDKGVWYLVHVA